MELKNAADVEGQLASRELALRYLEVLHHPAPKRAYFVESNRNAARYLDAATPVEAARTFRTNRGDRFDARPGATTYLVVGPDLVGHVYSDEHLDAPQVPVAPLPAAFPLVEVLSYFDGDDAAHLGAWGPPKPGEFYCASRNCGVARVEARNATHAASLYARDNDDESDILVIDHTQTPRRFLVTVAVTVSEPPLR